ncbi:MAG TPA: metabolite traffic protein EboE [Chitinophagaceae bacterium]
MLTESGHLTYCTNIHAGESWPDHFTALQNHFPSIKNQVSPKKPMGIGLRLSNEASMELIKEENLNSFKQWLQENNAYVFTMNGFPYGSFHRTRVKENVHAPDWTTEDRVAYTNRLFNILVSLLPGGMDGGVSTNPISYRHWFQTTEKFQAAKKSGTENMIHVVENLIQIHKTTGKILHLDVEPEPDGVLETGDEFIHWFENDLLKTGIPLLGKKLNVSSEEAEELIRQHLRLCYDVCHFAIGYEPHQKVIEQLLQRKIKIGKIQISAALKAFIHPENESKIKAAFANFNEPTYLHQVVAKVNDGKLLRYPDLPEAINDNQDDEVREWRAHFHVPVFAKDFDLLTSTRDEIIEVLTIQKNNPFTQHLEVETYTWEVLPQNLKLPIGESICRELKWVQQILD